MPRDYKGRAQAAGQQAKPVPGWIWFLTGLLVGGLSVGLVCLKALPTPKDGTGADTSATDAGNSRPAEQPAKVKKPTFDFPNILQEMTWGDPEPEPEPVTAPTRPTSPGAQPPKPQGRYNLQAGSFIKYADADRRKAELAFLGVTSRIQKSQVDGKTVYRLMVGPYTGESSANQAKRDLTGQGIETLVIKVD